MSKTKNAGNGNEQGQGDRPECFVIMPISDPDGYAPGHFRHVFEDLFVPACEQAGYRAVRADQVRQTNLIHLDILQRIIDSPMAICDLSSRNPNVLFELGLRQAFDKPVVLVQEAGTPPIFDIAPLRITSYRREMFYRDVIDDQTELAVAIAATRDTVSDAKSINSVVRLLGLTHAAALAAPAEGDETITLLRVIMNELSNVKSQVATLQTYPTIRKLYPASDETDMLPGLEALEEKASIRRESRLLLNLFEAHGIIHGCIVTYFIPRRIVRELVVASENFVQFCDNLLPTISAAEARSLEALIRDERGHAKLTALYDRERATVLASHGQPVSQPAGGGS